MKKIVYLDSYTLSPGDNPWDALSEQGDFTHYDRTQGGESQVIDRAKDANILITNKNLITSSVIDACPNLEYIGLTSTGYDVVDYEYAREKGIIVTNVPAYGTDTVAEMAMGLILTLARRTELVSDDVHAGGWSKNIDWTYWLSPQVELSGKTLGIIGFGNIGRRLGALGSAFKMNILAYDKNEENIADYDHKFVGLEELLEKSDVVSLHCPAFADNDGLINKDTLSLMKSSAYLINTARGRLVVEEDLANALNSGKIGGAGLDTLRQEPPARDNPLMQAKNCIITPHIAWATIEARERIMSIVSANLRGYLLGQPTNVINGVK